MSEYSKIHGNGGPPPTLERRVAMLETSVTGLDESAAHHTARFDKMDELLPYLIGRIDQALEGQRALTRQMTEGFAEIAAKLKTMGDHALESHERLRQTSSLVNELTVESKIQRRDIDHLRARISDARELNHSNNQWSREQLMSLTEEHLEMKKVPRNIALDITKGIVVAFFATLLTYLFNR